MSEEFQILVASLVALLTALAALRIVLASQCVVGLSEGESRGDVDNNL